MLNYMMLIRMADWFGFAYRWWALSLVEARIRTDWWRTMKPL